MPHRDEAVHLPAPWLKYVTPPACLAPLIPAATSALLARSDPDHGQSPMAKALRGAARALSGCGGSVGELRSTDDEALLAIGREVAHPASARWIGQTLADALQRSHFRGKRPQEVPALVVHKLKCRRHRFLSTESTAWTARMVPVAAERRPGRCNVRGRRVLSTAISEGTCISARYPPRCKSPAR